MIQNANILNNDVLYKKLSSLPNNMKIEMLDYLELLIHKYNLLESKIHPKAGCMKGLFVMSEDFNEPLECFKDYMP